MNPFPEQFELISFFESEPTLYDPSVPWFYNHLGFVTVRNRDRVECEIEPSDLIFRLRWYRDDIQLLNLNLEVVTGMEVESREGKEVMRVKFSETSGIGSLILQLEPVTHVFIELKMP
jgi:hypothetical protein